MTAATTRRPPATHRRHDAVAALRAVRAFALLATLSLAAAACAGHRGPSESDYQTNVGLSADSTLRIARTQLQLHAVTVTAAGENALVTTPRPVPEHLQGGSPGLRGRHWMLRVETQRRALVGGTRLRVIGMPRINLSVVRERVQNADQQPQALNDNLPYEMVIVGVVE